MRPHLTDLFRGISYPKSQIERYLAFSYAKGRVTHKDTSRYALPRHLTDKGRKTFACIFFIGFVITDLATHNLFRLEGYTILSML